MGQSRPTRAQRRKAQTRERLLRTAQVEMARRGIDGTAVLDITEAADVALGTFYNHFPSKEALLDVLADQLAEELSAELDDRVTEAPDEREALACWVLRVMSWFEADRERAAFVVEMGLAHGTLREHFGRQLYAMVTRGVDAGRFETGSPAVAAVTIGGALLSVMFARRRGLLGDASVGLEVATQALCQLSVPRAEATSIAESAQQRCG